MAKWIAKVALAITFLTHLLARIIFFWRRVENSERFLANYRADGIFPVGGVERDQMASFQRCQACSLCTFSCSAIKEGSAPPAFEPKYLMLGPSRSAHEGNVMLDEWIPCAKCSVCTVLCPNDVPIHAVVERIQERRKNFAYVKV